MHELAPIAGITAGIFSLTAYVPYILSIVRKETRPNRASWIIWLAVSAIITLSYRDAGATYAFWAPAGYTLGSTVVTILAIKYGVGGWTRFDRTCLMGAGIGLVLWRTFDSPMTALLINLLGRFSDPLVCLKIGKALLLPVKGGQIAGCHLLDSRKCQDCLFAGNAGWPLSIIALGVTSQGCKQGL